MSEDHSPAPNPAEPDSLKSAMGPAPAMPVIRPGELDDGAPHPLLEGPGSTIGWQLQPPADGGPAFVIIARTGLGVLKVADRFPLTEQGWAQAWQALVTLSPDAAGKAGAALIARAAEDRQLPRRHEPGSALTGAPPQVYPPGPGAGRASGAAKASLILGLIGFFLGFIVIGIFAAIPAVFLGHAARHDMRQTGETRDEGLALVGLVLGYFGIAWSALVFVLLGIGG